MKLVVLAVFCASGYAALQCGNDPIQNSFAELLVKNECKGRLGGIEACCVAHTNCYKSGATQQACDNNFCGCVAGQSHNLPGCKFYTDSFCNTARSFGGIQYNNLKPKPGK